MSDIKSKIVPNQLSPQSLSSVNEILKLAVVAAQEQDWLKVSNNLRLLPQTQVRRNRAKLFLLSEENWRIAFELALEMLIRADFQHKWQITKVLPWFGPKIIPSLSFLVKDDSVSIDVRWFICQILGNFPKQEVVLTLVELIQQTTDSELMAMAGKTLTQIGKNAVDALVDLLAQPEYRLLAVQSLFYIRTSETIEPLLSVVNDSDSQLRTIAIKALSSFHDHRIPPVLIKALQDPASSVRQEAAIALGFRPDLCQELNLVSHLATLLYDLNLQVCSHAAVSLGRMKQPEATQALNQALIADTTPTSLKLHLVKALGWSEIASAIKYLQQALNDSDELVTQEIITTLGRIKQPELKLSVAKTLVDFWQHQNHQSTSAAIKQALATSLGELRCNCAQPVLEKLATDKDRKVQLHALAALKKFSGS